LSGELGLAITLDIYRFPNKKDIININNLERTSSLVLR